LETIQEITHFSQRLSQNKKIVMNMESQQDQFMRIALARLQKDYRFFPQRVAVAARMYRKWVDRKQTQSRRA
jgi:hypothetical protein